MNKETLSVEELDFPLENIDVSEETVMSTPEYCLNCGTQVTDNFCPHCGQSIAVPQKITNKAFWKSLVMSFIRLNSSFGNTLVKLSYKPWEVIKDYIHGRQVVYTHPITMLIQVALYTAFIITFLEGILGVSLSAHPEVEGSNWFIKSLKDSTVIRVLWASVPVILAIYIAYIRNGSKRFSFSEYIIATLYLVITFRIYAFFLTLISHSFLNADLTSKFGMIGIILVSLPFGIITIKKAFPVKSKWKGVLLFFWFIILAITFYYIYSSFFHLLEDVINGNYSDHLIFRYFL